MKTSKKAFLFLVLICLASCQEEKKDHSPSDYYTLVNSAELLICQDKYDEALQAYKSAFEMIEKPFGKDVFNAGLVASFSENISDRNAYFQKVINNTTDHSYIERQIVGQYIDKDDWEKMLKNRKVDYDVNLRREFAEILARDQMHRPDYATYDDEINKNRKINLKRIIDLTNDSGFPSHIELGYAYNLRELDHHIVLHHTTQRRSRDKSVMDLEQLLSYAVETRRLDPEKAIFYMNFQNDLEKGRFEVYSTWRYRHPLLPDSLNSIVWLPRLSKDQIKESNEMRKKWHANSLEDISSKASYLSTSKHPFVFTSVNRSVGNLRDDFDRETALSQYGKFTRHMTTSRG